MPYKINAASTATAPMANPKETPDMTATIIPPNIPSVKSSSGLTLRSHASYRSELTVLINGERHLTIIIVGRYVMSLGKSIMKLSVNNMMAIKGRTLV